MTHKDIPGLIERLRAKASLCDGAQYPSLAELFREAATALAALRPAADPKAEGLVEWDRLPDALRETMIDAALDWGTGGAKIARDVYIALRNALAAPPTPDAERAGEPVGWFYHQREERADYWHYVEGPWPVAWGETLYEREPAYRGRPLASPQSPATDPPRNGSWVLLRTNLRPSVEARWGALNEDGEGWIGADGFWALEEGEDVIGYSQSPATEAVRVKLLPWREIDNGDFVAATIAADYKVQPGIWTSGWYWTCDDATYAPHKSFSEADEAKAAAQQDYEQRILSALIRPPVNNSPEPEPEQVVADMSKSPRSEGDK